MTLGIDPDLLHGCVQCGLCLSACPTFRVTGDEALSPRGRIALMRHVESGTMTADGSVLDALATCVQCRACEPACPSGVRYGRLIEAARSSLVDEPRVTPRRVKVLLRTLRHQRLLRLLSLVLAVAQRLHLVPPSLDPGVRVPVRRPPLVASGSDVVLFTGCVMDAWQRTVHLDAQFVVERTGAGVLPSGPDVGCCGALHAHAGDLAAARRFAEHVIASLPPDVPVLVDSAGCGAALKDYGHLLGTDAATSFAGRVVDVHEWLVANLDALPEVEQLAERVAIHDPCHLRHVQRAHRSVHDVLGRFVAHTVELDNDGVCCGAGGAYSIAHRSLSGTIRDRTLDSVRRTGASVVASANPGCAMHLSAGGAPTVHPVELIARALRSADAQRP